MFCDLWATDSIQVTLIGGFRGEVGINPEFIRTIRMLQEPTDFMASQRVEFVWIGLLICSEASWTSTNATSTRGIFTPCGLMVSTLRVFGFSEASADTPRTGRRASVFARAV